MDITAIKTEPDSDIERYTCVDQLKVKKEEASQVNIVNLMN